MTFPRVESEKNYYEKYRRQSQAEFDKLIPDFFEYEGEFYDLERIQYVYKDFTRAEDFEKLFTIKLLELKTKEYPIGEFLSFQQVDNFYGQKDSIDSFLYQLTEKDGNCYLLKELSQVIKDWIDRSNLVLLERSSFEMNKIEEKKEIDKKKNSLEKWNVEIQSLKGKELACKWNKDQIRNYFSFLYKEMSENGEPFLKKEQVDQIFENGFRIPEKPIDPLFKLNCGERYSARIVTFAINEFYQEASLKFDDKREYFLFFGSYIEDYSTVMLTKTAYTNFSKNSTKSPSARYKINRDKYLPSGIKVIKKSL